MGVEDTTNMGFGFRFVVTICNIAVHKDKDEPENVQGMRLRTEQGTYTLFNLYALLDYECLV